MRPRHHTHTHTHRGHTCMADECKRGAEASVCDAAVWRELKHHDAAVGQDRRRNAASAQHGYTTQSKTNREMLLFNQESAMQQRRGRHKRGTKWTKPYKDKVRQRWEAARRATHPTDYVSSFHVTEDGEGIIRASVWLFQGKVCKVKLEHNATVTQVCLKNIPQSCICAPLEDLVRHLHNVTAWSVDDPA